MAISQPSLLPFDLQTKRCSLCGKEKPFTEFSRDSRKKIQIRCQCKSCDKERFDSWKKRNPDYMADYMAEWRRLNSDYMEDWRKSNPNYSTIYSRRWRNANPEKRKAIRSNYRARKNNADGSHTAADIQQLLILQKNKCAVCCVSIAKNHHVDHVIPLALGGSNNRDNLQLLCPSCNQRKHAKHPIDFMQSRGMLL